MGDTMAAITDQYWTQFQQPLMDGGQAPDPAPPAEWFSGATAVTARCPATVSSSEVTVLSPNSSYTASTTTASQLTPKSNIAFKPARRRSRASKRTPTTLLNANTTNFRALVQQFTGCPRTAMSFGVHKGPITLDFRQQQQQQQTLHHNTTRIIAPFGNNKVEKLAHQQNGYSFHSSSSNSRANNMEVSEGLLLDNDFGLHELTVNDFSFDI